MSLVQRITLAFGIVYAAVGVLGFIPGITVPSAHPGHGLLLGIFAVNTIHNLAHLLLGGVLIWGGLGPDRAVTVNRVMAAVFMVLTVASFIAPIVEGVALNPPDTILHFGSMLLTAYLGFVAARPAEQLASNGGQPVRS